MDDPPPNRTSPPFSLLVEFFEKISNVSGAGVKDRRHELISQFLKNWRELVGDDVYPAFQLILPHLDSENSRRLYNLKENKFGKLLVAAMNLNALSTDAKQLLEFRNAKGKSAGNFAEIAFGIIDKRDTNLEFSKCTVDDVLIMLADLSEGKFSQQVEVLQKMILKMNALELKWIIRIVLGSMHLHVSEHTFFYCWHPDAQALFNVTNDLKIVCHQLWDKSIRLQAKDQEIKPGSCFKPQRSKFRKKAVDQFELVVQQMPSFGFYLEEKMDGERMQLHWINSGKEIKYFSRKGKDYTGLYGRSKSDASGTLSRFLGDYINQKVTVCVLDGEMVAYDSKNKEICPLTKVKQAAIGDEAGQWNPLFMVFDIVHLNGKDLSHVALKERKRALEMVIPKENRAIAQERMQILPYMLAHTEEQVRTEFEKVIAELSEGLIIKNPLSRYTVDGYNDAWIKVKPEFMYGYESENFDLVVVGAYYGRGKRGSILASFLCAVRGDDDNEYYTVCKVGNGFCMAMYEKIAHLNEGKWIDFEESLIPDKVHLGSETPHKLIKPGSSFVLEVKATQIWPSEKFTAHYSLRFPRFVSLREDKSPENALTLSQLALVNEEQNPEERKKRKTETAPKPRTKQAKFQHSSVKVDAVETMIFDGLTMFVAGDVHESGYVPQADLEHLIKTHGGTITRDVSTEGAIIVADEKLPRIAHLVDQNAADVVSPRWVYDCVENKRVLNFEPDHFYYATKESAENSRKYVDELGFSLSRGYRLSDISRKLQSLQQVLPCTRDQLKQTLDTLISNGGEFYDTRALMFHDVIAYFDESVEPDRVKELQRYVQFGSGLITVVSSSPAITHVICDDPDRRAIYAKHQGPFIVNSDWLIRSWDSETKIDELKGL